MRRSPLRSDPEKRRAFIERGRRKSAESLNRSRSPLQRKTRIKPVNRERRERVRGDEVYGPYHEWVSSLPCLREGPDCLGKVTGHHIVSVGAGGKDHGNEVPLCANHHAMLHTWGQKTAEERWGVDLEAEAKRLAGVDGR